MSSGMYHSNLFMYRYLLDLKRNSEETPDPSKEAVVDQWVEWESITLQVSLFCWNQRILGFYDNYYKFLSPVYSTQ